MSSSGAAVACRDLKFAYGTGPTVLDVPTLEVTRGESVFLYGPSGSGKTTLLGLIAGVLRPTAGEVRVLGTDLATRSAGARDAFRAQHIGYVFQMFNLIPYLSVRENITLPCRLNGARRERLGGQSLDAAAHAMAAELHIEEYLDRPVTDLSVGQQQRVAAARALIGHPEVVIADEPTSALDTDRREAFLKLLFASCAKAEATLVFVSHDLTLQPLFSRVLDLTVLNHVARRVAVA